tara:strand:+ start:2805 stop:4007 length:1203 start_codon:yes stop_codon:yes gene_type:complete
LCKGVKIMKRKISAENNNKNLIIVSKILNKEGIEFFPFYGTLLGLVREDSCIEGDDDIDMMISYENREQVYKIMSDLGMKNTDIGRNFLQFTYRIKNQPVIVDFYLFEEEDEYLIEKWNFFGKERDKNYNIHYDKKFIFPLDDKDWKGTKLKIPCNSEWLVEHCYGKEWKEKKNKGSEYRHFIVDNKIVIKYSNKEKKMTKTYCIKENYKHRSSYTHYSDIGYEDQYQDEVYETAYRICQQHDLRTIFDVGCGSAFKLRKYFTDHDFIGAEIEPTLSWLKKEYPTDKWIQSDFTKSVEADLIICSDVIEHLIDPDELISFFKKSKYKFIVLSTPEREAVQIYQKGFLWNGPPLNPAHTREWSFSEFHDYISDNLNVIKHFTSKNKAETSALCQIMVIKND